MKTTEHRFSTRGHCWRVQSDERGRFDEIVVAGSGKRGLILHAEMMNHRSCFIDICGLVFWTYVGKGGIARITSAEDRRSKPELERVRLSDGKLFL